MNGPLASAVGRVEPSLPRPPSRNQFDWLSRLQTATALKNQQPLKVSAARCGPFSVCLALKFLVAELSQKKSYGKHWTALLACKPRSWCLKQNSSGVEARKASIPPLTLDFLAVLVQSSTRQFWTGPYRHSPVSHRCFVFLIQHGPPMLPQKTPFSVILAEGAS
jgi:hypothetical protein